MWLQKINNKHLKIILFLFLVFFLSLSFLGRGGVKNCLSKAVNVWEMPSEAQVTLASVWVAVCSDRELPEAEQSPLLGAPRAEPSRNRSSGPVYRKSGQCINSRYRYRGGKRRSRGLPGHVCGSTMSSLQKSRH